MKFPPILFFFFFAMSASGQSGLSDTTYVLDEFVISANKIPELRSKLSQQVYVMRDLRITKLSTQTSADLISNSGTVAVQKSQQGGGSAQIRGFEASRVLMVIDGVRMNNLIYRAGHLQNMIALDQTTLERVEILFGPSSTVYGSDALGGVIHFRTKDPMLTEGESLRIKANAFFRYGSVNQEKTTHVDLNLGSKRFASFSALTFSDFGDLRMGKKTNQASGEPFGLRPFYVVRPADNTQDVLSTNQDPYVQKFSGYSQYDFLQKFLFTPEKAVSHSLNLQFSNSSNVPRYDRLTDQEGDGLRNAEWYYGPQKRFFIAYQLKVDKPWKFADVMRNVLSYQNIRESRHDRRFDSEDRGNQIERVEVWAFTTDFQKVLKSHDIRFGLDVQFNEVKSQAFNQNVINGEHSPAATRYPDGKNVLYSYALYLTHSHDISSKVTLNDGVRIGLSTLNAEFHNKTFFPFPFNVVNQKNSYASGNLGLVFRPQEHWRFSFLTSTGYRVPNIDDIAKVFDTHAGESLIVPNPDVKPEKTVNFDLGLSRHITDRVSWENTFFYTFLYDAIVLDAFTFEGKSEIIFEGQPTQVLANQNKRRAYITGFTSLLHGDLSRSFSTEISFNYTRGRILTPSGQTPLDHIPPAFGRVSLQYHQEKFSSEVFANFNNWKRISDYLLNSEDNEMYATPDGMPSWYTLNLRMGFEFTSHFTLQGGVDNLFDLQYRTFSSGINAPGRNIFVTLKLGF